MPQGRLGIHPRPERSRTIGVGQHPEEAVETARGSHDEKPTRSRHNAAMRMRHPARQGKEVTRAYVEPIAAALEDVLALQDVEQLVLVLVDVQGRIEQRWQLRVCANVTRVGCSSARTATRADRRLRRSYPPSGLPELDALGTP